MLIRPGRTRSHRVRASRSAMALVGGLTILVLAAASAALGRVWQSRVDAGRIAALEEEVRRLTRETAQVTEVAGRLAELEGAYGQLREVMGGGVAESSRDVLLPAPLREAPNGSIAVTDDDDAGAVWPLVEPGFVTRAFGDTAAPPFEDHVGVDIAVPVGSYVRSVSAGVVTEAGDDREYGKYVKIVHSDAVRSLYAHNSWLFVVEGDSVETGEVIALSGNTGRSTAPHLHLELEQDGVPVDPLGVTGGGG